LPVDGIERNRWQHRIDFGNLLHPFFLKREHFVPVGSFRISISVCPVFFNPNGFGELSHPFADGGILARILLLYSIKPLVLCDSSPSNRSEPAVGAVADFPPIAARLLRPGRQSIFCIWIEVVSKPKPWSPLQP
jgi:hypothetical protein